jgi:hypothetical protein
MPKFNNVFTSLSLIFKKGTPQYKSKKKAFFYAFLE